MFFVSVDKLLVW